MWRDKRDRMWSVIHLVSGTSCNQIFVVWESIARALKFSCFIQTKAGI